MRARAKEPGNSLTRSRARAREVSTQRPEPLAPNIRALFLPHWLNDWHLLGEQWFERWILDFYADIPTHPWEHPSAFGRGAVCVVARLLQRTITPPCRIVAVSRRPKDPTLRRQNKVALLETFGVATVVLEISLNAANHKILSEFKRFLHNERRKRKIKLVAARPASIANLKRDFVVFALATAGWDIPSIQAQMAHMGCKPFPAGTDPKQFVRKIRSRYDRLSDEIEGTNWLP